MIPTFSMFLTFCLLALCLILSCLFCLYLLEYIYFNILYNYNIYYFLFIFVLLLLDFIMFYIFSVLPYLFSILILKIINLCLCFALFDQIGMFTQNSTSYKSLFHNTIGFRLLPYRNTIVMSWNVNFEQSTQ